MTVLLSADCMGGVWTYALDLIRALPEHHFVLATMGERPNEAQRQAATSLPNVTLRESDFKLEWMDEPWNDVKHAGRWLLELEREFSPDLVHLNGYAHAALPFAAPVLVVAHSCVLSWWRAVLGEDAPASWDYYRLRVSTGLGAATAIVSPTKAYGDELQAIYGDIGCVRVIYNGSSPVTPDEQKLAQEPFVLCAGRVWDKAKNIAVLDEVAPRLKTPICVAGAQTQGAQELVVSNLNLLGVLEQPALFELMNQAAIWVHPARYEPFGLAVLEAAARGCALVLSDLPTLRELWDDSAHFVAPNDIGGWTKALQELLESPSQQQDAGRRARQRAAQYSLDRFGAGYAQLYDEMTR